ncbi:MAG TPA: GNAT family N-acetyltransferase [Blastocatellia bacterium]|nr:GNAT family N-acetyltransferase [Blastocatellia bacterium]
MPDDLTIRLATSSDASALARSRYSFRASLGEPCEDEEGFVARCSLWMRERLDQQSRWLCWVAEQDRVIVGHLWMQIIEKIPNPIIEPEFHAYITNFYVREEQRGGGVGSKLLEAALGWAKAQEVEAVILWPTERSRPLYERHGFAVREDLLELMIK